ncbi:hypothetical protein K504DRAFT_511193 [Pleomassaria siparia CBS 279.74]|uniref:Rhodopsin domain-containing protein n=1 Tax=Pleomassaria siparia CBS 279.74 TaxID=1314801 RepID=A0A6G1KT04_9PLEO|nr:hypothetical protein K504DRAFT_511193 [Pleomassaria siparia CBS 279.74]
MSKPLVPAPPGYTVDVAHPQRQGQVLNYWVASVGMVLATVFVGIRAYTKIVLVRKWASEDWCLLCAWRPDGYVHGILGIHIWELTGWDMNLSSHVHTAVTVVYSPMLGLAKMSLLILYLKLSPVQWFRIAVYAIMFINFGATVGIVFPLIFGCNPVAQNFDIRITAGSCIDRASLFVATAVLNMIIDIILLLLPIPMVVNLQMSRSKKISLLAIFGVGSFTVITSGVRLVLLRPMLKNPDSSWVITYPGIWSLVECSLVIVTGAMPTMRKFLRHVAPSLLGESSATDRSHKSGSLGPSKRSNTELQTIGTKASRKQYGRMEGDDDLHSLGSDGNSETALEPTIGILQTRAVDVTSEEVGSRGKVYRNHDGIY